MRHQYEDFLKRLVKQGYSIVHATDSEEAAEHIENAESCLVVSPGMVESMPGDGMMNRIFGIYPRPVIISVQSRN